eukprot:gene29768-5416_t
MSAAQAAIQDEAKARSGDNTNVQDALRRISTYFRSNQNKNGRLEPQEVTLLLKSAMPSLTPQELRYIMAFLYPYLDEDRDGAISYYELTIGLRAVDANVTPDDRSGSGSRRPRTIAGTFRGTDDRRVSINDRDARSSHDSGRQDEHSSSRSGARVKEWVLEDLRHKGESYLLDREANLIYAEDRVWPRLVGRINSDQRVVSHKPRNPGELYTRLDEYLKRNKVRLQDLFEQYDRDRSGELSLSELGRLIKSQLPDTTKSEVLFFAAMMDTDSNGRISYNEFVNTATASMEAMMDTDSNGRISYNEFAIMDTDSNGRISYNDFAMMDTDGNGHISYDDFIKTATATIGGTRGMEAMMDTDGNSRISYDEFVKTAAAIMDATRGMVDGRLPNDVMRVLDRLSRMLANDTETVRREFERLDRSRRGFLEPSELPPLLKILLPGLSNKDVQIILYHLGNIDVNGDGAISFKELMVSMRAIEPATPRRTRYQLGFTESSFGGQDVGRSPPSAGHSETRDSRDSRDAAYRPHDSRDSVQTSRSTRFSKEWRLERYTGRGDRVEAVDKNATMDLFVKLDRYLKEEQVVRFSDLFNKFDRSRRGALGASDLKELLKEVMRDATNSQTRFFMDAGVVRVLDDMSRFLYRDAQEVKAIWDAEDTRGVGFLEYHHVARFMRKLTKRLSHEELVQVTFTDFMRAMHAVDLITPRGSHERGFRAIAVEAPVASSPGRNSRDTGKSGTAGYSKDSGGYSNRSSAPLQKDISTWNLEAYGSNRDYLIDKDSILDQYLRSERVRFRELFEHFDRDRSGTLDSSELRQMIQQLMPHATDTQLRYFRSMLDCGGNVRLTSEEFITAASQCMGAEADAHRGMGLPREVVAILKDLSRFINRNRLRRMWDQYDREGSGYLEPQYLMQLFKGAIPKISETALRYIGVQLYLVFMDGDGVISFVDMVKALRGVELRTPDYTYPAGVWPERREAKRVAVVRELVLEELSHGGKKFLLDRTSGTVYTQAAIVNGQAAWPKAAGTYDRTKRLVNMKQSSSNSADLFTALDNHLKTQRKRFSEFDVDRNGSLDTRELAQMVKELLRGRATQADLSYFIAVLDIDGSRSVTEEEFLRVASEYVEVERMMADDVVEEVFAALQDFSNRLGNRREEIYNEFFALDTDADGCLAHTEIIALMRWVMPELSNREINYLITHLHFNDTGKAGKFTFNELLVAFHAVPIVLPGGRRIEIGWTSRLSNREINYLITHLHFNDTGKPGKFTFNELLVAFHAVPIVLPVGRRIGIGWTSRPQDVRASRAVVAPSRVKSLEEQSLTRTQADLRDQRINGRPYLMDKLSGFVYEPPPQAETTPYFAGRVLDTTSTVFELLPPVFNLENDIFHVLDHVSRENRDWIQHLFDQYDSSGCGRVGPDDLGAMVRDALGDASEAEIKYVRMGPDDLGAMVRDTKGDASEAEIKYVLAMVIDAAGIAELSLDGVAMMMDAAGNAELSLDGVVRSLKECLQISAAACNKDSAEAALIGRSYGKLDAQETAELFANLSQNIRRKDIRYILAHLHFQDVVGEGENSMLELIHHLQAIDVRLPSGIILRGGTYKKRVRRQVQALAGRRTATSGGRYGSNSGTIGGVPMGAGGRYGGAGGAMGGRRGGAGQSYGGRSSVSGGYNNMGGRIGGTMGSTMAGGFTEVREWSLSEFQDPDTQIVLLEDQENPSVLYFLDREQKWPIPVGVQEQDGTFVQLDGISKLADILETLGSMQIQQLKLRDFIAMFGLPPNSGKLDRDSLADLVDQVMPGLEPLQASFLLTLLDPDGAAAAAMANMGID